MSITGSAIERIYSCVATRSCFVIRVANATRLWAVTTATLVTINLMTLRRVLMLRLLTMAVRFTLSTRAGVPGSSRRAYLKRELCNGTALLVVNKDY